LVKNEGMPDLAARLNRLFATVPRPGGGSWTNDEAAAGINETGVHLSGAYLSQLRTGKRNNPSARHLAAIARFFEVPVDYFFDSAVTARIDEQLELLIAMRDTAINKIALRAKPLSPGGLSGVAGMVEYIRQQEGITDSDPAPGADQQT
jgi:transcriptional regulator with XRE-family HTH domain